MVISHVTREEFEPPPGLEGSGLVASLWARDEESEGEDDGGRGTMAIGMTGSWEVIQ